MNRYCVLLSGIVTLVLFLGNGCSEETKPSPEKSYLTHPGDFPNSSAESLIRPDFELLLGADNEDGRGKMYFHTVVRIALQNGPLKGKAIQRLEDAGFGKNGDRFVMNLLDGSFATNGPVVVPGDNLVEELTRRGKVRVWYLEKHATIEDWFDLPIPAQLKHPDITLTTRVNYGFERERIWPE